MATITITIPDPGGAALVADFDSTVAALNLGKSAEELRAIRDREIGLALTGAYRRLKSRVVRKRTTEATQAVAPGFVVEVEADDGE